MQYFIPAWCFRPKQPNIKKQTTGYVAQSGEEQWEWLKDGPVTSWGASTGAFCVRLPWGEWALEQLASCLWLKALGWLLTHWRVLGITVICQLVEQCEGSKKQICTCTANFCKLSPGGQPGNGASPWTDCKQGQWLPSGEAHLSSVAYPGFSGELNAPLHYNHTVLSLELISFFRQIKCLQFDHPHNSRSYRTFYPISINGCCSTETLFFRVLLQSALDNQTVRISVSSIFWTTFRLSKPSRRPASSITLREVLLLGFL